MPGEGKVLKILDEFTIVVSLGWDVVKKGDHLVVYSLGAEIKDGDRSLGRLENIKARVVVDYVQENFSTAVAPTYHVQGISAFSTTILGTETRRDPLPLAETPTPTPSVDKTIRVGDLVKLELGT